MSVSSPTVPSRQRLAWAAGLGSLVVMFSWWYISTYGFAVFLQQLINGLQRGSLYALIALGFTMVYGIIELINFAHGDIFMFGAYIAAFVGGAWLGQGYWITFLGALVVNMVITALLGVLI